MNQSGVPLLMILGSIAGGLVWGWLVGLLAGRVRRKLLTPLLIMLATLVVAVEIWWFLRLSSLAYAAVAGALSFSIHAAWRSHLRSQAQAFPPGTGGQP